MRKKHVAFIFVLIAAGILIGLTVAAYDRNSVYKSTVTLWADAASKSIDKRRTHENYGQALSTAGSLSNNQQDAFAFYEEALRQFRTVLALKDDGSVPPRDVYRELGVVYFRMGQMDDAITAWQTGLRYAPGDPSLLNNLSVAYMQKNDFDQAEATVRQALSVDPNMPHLLNSMGEILMAKGNYGEALNYFLAAIERDPDDPTRYLNAAIAFERTGKPEKAYDYATRYAAMVRDSFGQQRAQAYLERLKTLYFSKSKS